MGSRPGTALAPAAAAAQQDFTRKNLVASSSSSSTSHKTPVTALAWSSSGRKLASASMDGTVKVWAVSSDTVHSGKTDKPEHDFAHGKECVTSLVFNPRREDQLLVVGSHVSRVWTLGPKGSVSVHCEAAVPSAISAAWDTHDNILVAQLDNKFSHIDLRKAAADGSSGSKDKKRSVKSYAINQGDEVVDVLFIDRGRRVLIATQHGVEVRSWPSGFQEQLLTVLDGHAKHGGRDGGVTAMAVTREEDNKPHKPITRLLATGGSDTLVCIWDLQQCVPQTVIYRPDEPVRALSFSADAALLAYCQGDTPGQPSSVVVVDVKTGSHVTSVPLQRNTEVLAFNPRYPKLLALAEPLPVNTSSSSYASRDSKAKEVPPPSFVSLVQLK